MPIYAIRIFPFQSEMAKFVMNVADLWPEGATELEVATNRLLIEGVQWPEEFLYGKEAWTARGNQSQSEVDYFQS
jgi:hypothetical protein